MRRRVFLGTVTVGLLLAGGSPTSRATILAQAPRPNILFILADDLDTGVFDRMPRLRSLLTEQGTTFQNHFVSLSLCCPSRTTILRGQYAHNTRIFTNNLPGGGFRKVYNLGLESSTAATWLQDDGYRTVLLGKYLNGYPMGAGQRYVPPGWNEWYSPVAGAPYSNFNYTLNENGALITYGNVPEDYLTDVLSAKATDFIARASADGVPFFMYLATYAPHGPATPAPRHANEFPGVQAPRTASFNEEDVSDKPEWVQTHPRLTQQQINQMDSLYRRRLQSMLAVEDLISSLIDTLDATGQLDNTYIFFTSDNGFHQGQHRLVSGKNTGFEEDLRVPSVVRGPGVPAGVTRPHLTVNIDFAPTFAELARATTPDFVDGRSLVPLLGPDPPPVGRWRQAFLLEHAFPGDSPTEDSGLLEPPDAFDTGRIEGAPQQAPVFQGLRTAENLAYVEYVTGERELYDLTSDPDELDNSYSTADPLLLRRLARWLDNLRGCAGATCRAAEDAPPRRAP